MVRHIMVLLLKWYGMVYYGILCYFYKNMILYKYGTANCSKL